MSRVGFAAASRLARELLERFRRFVRRQPTLMHPMNLHRSIIRRPSLVLLIAFLTGTLLPAARASILALDWSHLSAAYQSGAANAGMRGLVE